MESVDDLFIDSADNMFEESVDNLFIEDVPTSSEVGDTKLTESPLAGNTVPSDPMSALTQEELAAVPSRGIGEELGVLSRIALPTPMNVYGVATSEDWSDSYRKYLSGEKDFASDILSPTGVESPVTTAVRTAAYVVDAILDPVALISLTSKAGVKAVGRIDPEDVKKQENVSKLSKANTGSVDVLPPSKEARLTTEELQFHSPEEMQALKMSEDVRRGKVDANQLEVIKARNMPREQLVLQLGDETDTYVKRGSSNASVSEAGERIKDPETETLSSVLEKVDDAPFLSKAGLALNVFGGKAISPIREMGRYSPSLKKVADLMDAGIDNTTKGFHSNVMMANGKFMPALEGAVASARRKIGAGISKDTNNSIASGLRGLKTSHPAEVAKLKNTLNMFHKYMKDAGVKVGYVKDFFPRRYNTDILSTKNGKEDFLKALVRSGVPMKSAKRAYDNIINGGGFMNLSVLKGSWRNANSSSPLASSLKGRGLDVPDSVLEPFLRSDNVYTTLTDYMSHGIRVAEYTRAFGVGESELNKLMKSSSLELAKHGKDLDDIKQTVEDVADSLVHAYRPINTNTAFGKGLRAANRAIVPLVHITTLPMVTLSSLSEPVMILGRASLRPSSVLKAVPTMLAVTANTIVRKAFKGVEKHAAIRASEDVGLALDSAVTERLHGMTQGDFSAVSAVFFKAALLHDFTKLTMIAANETGRNMIKGHLKELSMSKASVKRREVLSKDLLALGVSPKDGVEWIKRGASIDDPFFNEFVRVGGQRFATDVIMVPRSTQLPLWHSNPHVKLFAQLKSFPTMFGNTVIKNWFNQIVNGTPKQRLVVAATGVTATMVGMLSNEIQDYIKYGENGSPYKTHWEPYQKVMAGMDRFGAFGMGSAAGSALTAHEFGQDPMTAAAGAAASKATQLVRIVAAAGSHALGHKDSLDVDKALAKFISGNMSFASVNREFRDKRIKEPIEKFLKGL